MKLREEWTRGIFKTIKAVLDWERGIREKHTARNVGVVTRQSERRALFETAMDSTNQKYGGEPRKARRKIARALAKRSWLERRESESPA
jgi:hypothetical protein